MQNLATQNASGMEEGMDGWGRGAKGPGFHLGSVHTATLRGPAAASVRYRDRHDKLGSHLLEIKCWRCSTFGNFLKTMS